MRVLVQLIGLVMAIMGAIYLVKPSIMKKVIRFWIKRSHIYFGVALSIVIGILLIIAAFWCERFRWFVILMGILSVIKGIIPFVWGQKKCSEFADKIIHSSATTLRILSIVVISLGVILVLIAK